MAVLRPADPHRGRFSAAEGAAKGKGEPLLIEPNESRAGAWARRRALAETSAAFSAGGTDLAAVCAELAHSLARALQATCLIRPMDTPPSQLPVALGQTGGRAQRELAELVEVDPYALGGACSARAAEIRGSILLTHVSQKCLRLWSGPAAWPVLEALHVRSMLVTPVCTRRRVVGSIVVWRRRAARLQFEDQVFVEEVARRLAGACR